MHYVLEAFEALLEFCQYVRFYVEARFCFELASFPSASPLLSDSHTQPNNRFAGTVQHVILIAVPY